MESSTFLSDLSPTSVLSVREVAEAVTSGKLASLFISTVVAPRTTTALSSIDTKIEWH